jgi:hypothetical protein
MQEDLRRKRKNVGWKVEIWTGEKLRTLCDGLRLRRLICDADQFFNLVAHFALEHFNLFQDDTVLNHGVDQISSMASTCVALLVSKRLTWWCAFAQRVPDDPTSSDKYKRLEVGQQEMVFQREKRYAICYIQILRTDGESGFPLQRGK